MNDELLGAKIQKFFICSAFVAQKLSRDFENFIATKCQTNKNTLNINNLYNFEICNANKTCATSKGSWRTSQKSSETSINKGFPNFCFVRIGEFVAHL